MIGRFEFRIEVDGVEHTRTRDTLKAAKILFDLGVDSPLQLIDHSREWGMAEIVDPPVRRVYRQRSA